MLANALFTHLGKRNSLFWFSCLWDRQAGFSMENEVNKINGLFKLIWDKQNHLYVITRENGSHKASNSCSGIPKVPFWSWGWVLRNDPDWILSFYGAESHRRLCSSRLLSMATHRGAQIHNTIQLHRDVVLFHDFSGNRFFSRNNPKSYAYCGIW